MDLPRLPVARDALYRASLRWLAENGNPDRPRDYAAVLSERDGVLAGPGPSVASYRPEAPIRPAWYAQNRGLAAGSGALLCVRGAAEQEPTERERAYWGESHYQHRLSLGAPERVPELPLVVCAGLDPFLEAAQAADAALAAGRSSPNAHARLAPGWYQEPLAGLAAHAPANWPRLPAGFLDQGVQNQRRAVRAQLSYLYARRASVFVAAFVRGGTANRPLRLRASFRWVQPPEELLAERPHGFSRC